MSLMREPGDGYMVERTHLHHVKSVFQMAFLATLFLLVISHVLWFYMYMRVANPVILHGGAGVVSADPDSKVLQFAAWEVLRPYLTMDSGSVTEDLQGARRFMTEARISKLDRDLAAYEVKFKRGYAQAVAEMGIQTQFGEVQSERLADVEIDGTKRYVVRVFGERVLISKARGTGEPTKFEYIVILDRAPVSKTNGMGLLVADIAPAPVKGTDGSQKPGYSIVPFETVGTTGVDAALAK